MPPHLTASQAWRIAFDALRILTLSVLTLTGCHTTPSAALTPPPAPREFRAAWVATVENIDWPSKAGLSTVEQQREIIAILDRASELKLNAIVLQVRTSCDAFYDSKLEPWSQYLTGVQGQAPNPYYDPLEFWIDESHRRGIELHAWFNPYRARHNAAKGEAAALHVSKSKPQIVKSFNGWQWLDPGEPEAVKQTLAVFKDVVHRYAVDGVHMDDYFYPYAEYLTAKGTTQPADFPDDHSFAAYQKTGGKLSRPDWRRQNVDELVRQINTVVHAERKTVKFGISPFGLGRPDRRPDGIKGMSQFDELYADVETWLANQWCDYLTPQLYWQISKKAQAYPVLVAYWKTQVGNRNLWPGLYASKYAHPPKPTTTPSTKPADTWSNTEIADEIDITRQQLGDKAGVVLYSMKSLMAESDMTSALMSTQFHLPALVPPSPWLDAKPPATPSVKVVGVGSSSRRVQIAPALFSDQPWLYAIWTRENGGWLFHLRPASQARMEINTNVSAVVVTAVSHTGVESKRVTVEIKAN